MNAHRDALALAIRAAARERAVVVRAGMSPEEAASAIITDESERSDFDLGEDLVAWAAGRAYAGLLPGIPSRAAVGESLARVLVRGGLTALAARKATDTLMAVLYPARG